MRLVPFSLSVLVLAAGTSAIAQAGEWQKAYPLSGKASLHLSSGDASVEVRSCGGCRELRVRVDWQGRKPDDFTLTEFQSGNHIEFALKEKPHHGFLFQTNLHNPRIAVDTPAALDLDAHTSDGGLKISGIQGSIELHTSDGAVDVEDVTGTVRLTASDGSIRIHNLTGTLESHSSDGRVTIDGRLFSVQVQTSDGSLELSLYEGSKLTAASRIQSSDGKVTVRLPRTLAADLEVQTSDGQIDCGLPLTMQDYNTAHSKGHQLRGHLNGGGVPLTIHTSDGNVTIAAL
jgi:DUF4097 and DUF4098 domain-containing protein YvlB